MQALVLVGGLGTRLRPLTDTMPKPIVPLVDRPFLSFVIEWLGRHGVDEIVLACGFRTDSLRDALGEVGQGGPALRYVEEPEARGTAGAIKFAEEHLDDRFLALNGDVLADLDLTTLVRAHEKRGARATIGLHPVDDPAGYGLVRTEPGGEVAEFVEKPDEPDPAGPNEINSGAYVLERSVLDLVPPGEAVSIEREVFPRLVGEGLYGVRLEGYWMDIGTPERYLQASWDILEGTVRTAVEPRPDAVLVDSGADLAGKAAIGPRAVVSARCRIEAGATVRESVMLEGSRVGEGATVERSILSPGASVEPGAVLRGTVVGAGERVGG